MVALAGACTGDDTPQVEVAGVDAGEVTQTISAPATVQAANRQPVTAATGGVVKRLFVDDGDNVTQGELVVRLSNDDVQAALQQAEAARATAGAAPPSIAVDPPGDVALVTARQSVADLDADVLPDLRKARNKAQDVEDADERRAALQTVDLLEEAYHDVRHVLLDAGQAAAAQQNALAQTFAGTLEQALGQVVSQATAGQAAQASQAAELAAAQAENLDLFAPFDGVLQFGAAATGPAAALPGDLPAGAAEALAGELGAATAAGGGQQGGQLQVGSDVVAGQTVFTVFDLSELYVQADVDEIDAPQLQVGQPADVLLDAFPDRVFAGEVTSVALEPQTGATGGVSYPVRVKLLDLPGRRSRRPRLGMTASAEIVTDTVAGQQVVPARAIVRRGGGQAVFVVRDDVAVLVPVQVEALGEERAAVQSTGLADDDLVIVSGYENLTDGDAVRVPQ